MASNRDNSVSLLVAEAVSRPPVVWSPYDGHETRCYRPQPTPSDPERPFGIVRKLGEYRFQELTGHEDPIRRRSRLVDALSGLVHYYRTSCYWHSDVEPEAQFCLLCGGRNLNHPDFDPFQDPFQCQVIRDHTLDGPIRLSDNPIFRMLETAVTEDLLAMLESQNLEWG